MKQNLLALSLALAFAGANAAEPTANAAPAAQAAPAKQAAPAAAPRALRSTRADAALDPKEAEQARRELADLGNQMRDISRRIADLSVKLGDVGPRAYAFRYLGDPDRAVLGIVFAGENHGVRVTALTPDGPAMRAGLRTGDVIVGVDGEPFEDAHSPEEGDEIARDALSDLHDGQAVKLDYLRDGKKGSVTIKAERREAADWSRLFGGSDLAELSELRHTLQGPEFRQRIREAEDAGRAAAEQVQTPEFKQRIRAEVEQARKEARQAQREAMRASGEYRVRTRDAMRMVMPWWGLNLAALNPDLGRYFGSDRGVLVIAADDDSLPGLKPGDVITAVAGEKVERPEDALRALRDQPAGKEILLSVLRDRKSLALKVKAPEFKSIFEMHPPVPPVPPTPPAPVAAPAAPPPVHGVAAIPPVPPTPAAHRGVAPPPAPRALPAPPAPPHDDEDDDSGE